MSAGLNRRVGNRNRAGDLRKDFAGQVPVVHLFLIKPSKYDDEGFVVRHWRGVLPSNTLACLCGLTEDVRRRGLLAEVDLRVHLVDETVAKIPLARIVRLNRQPGQRAVVGLVGVQTNQFCRAADIALSLRRKAIPVVIGGFHVSGVLALFPDGTPDIQHLLDAGVSVVAGEVEHRWAEVLRDACEGKLRPIYRFVDELPDLSHAPRPLISKQYMRKFVRPDIGTMDCSRGCPFNCSFCTVINVQGRKTRHRSPECIEESLRHNYLESGVTFYFFTDDDFSRNPAWEEIFDRLIHLREQEGIPIGFMIQVDVLCHQMPNFIEKAARAGCSNVFIGMESINPRNLKEAGKTQNHVEEYKNLINAWHDARVSTHVGYIIGFPHDTEESVRKDVSRLMRDVQPHRTSFFMMTPLPGSRDHQQMVETGAAMDSDYNVFDSFHESMPHPHMKNGTWSRAYQEAWQRFYSFENMKAILSRAHPDNYWAIFRNFYWYKNAAFNERIHPMLAGVFPIRDRKTRRAGFPREGRLAHMRRRIPEVYRYITGVLRLTLEMEELWLQTRRRSDTERRVLEELAGIRAEVGRNLRIAEFQTAYARAKLRMPSIEVPSKLSLLRERVSFLRVSRLRQTRRDLLEFWISLRRRLRHGRPEILLRVDRIAINVIREIRLAAGFLIALATAESHEVSQE